MRFEILIYILNGLNFLFMMKKVLLWLVVWTMSAAAAFAQDASTVTVYDGEDTNAYVPVYGLYADAYLKCEYVIPAESLADATGGQLTSLTWYLQTPAASAWGANFQVFLKEVNGTTLSAYEGPSGGQIVYEGPLDGTSTEIKIDFTESYTYGGGDLLVGIYNTAAGTYKSAKFYGKNADGVSITGYSYSSLDAVSLNQRNFGPKTMFEYTAGSGPVLPRPSNLVVSNITPTSAVVSWTPAGEETSWNVAFKKHSEEEWQQFSSNEASFNLDPLEKGNDYDVRVQAVYAEGTSSWITTRFVTTICEDSDKGEIFYELGDSYGDGWGANAIQVVYHDTGIVLETISLASGSSGSGSFQLCYGETYDFIWVSGSYGAECSFKIYDAGGTIIEHAAGTAPAAGALCDPYLFKYVSCAIPRNVVVSDVVYNGAKVSWTPGAEGQDAFEVVYSADEPFDPDAEGCLHVKVNGSNSTVLDDLSETTTYHVAVRACCSDEEVSNWSNAVGFTTPEQFPAPTALQSYDVRARQAKVVWKGQAESYNIRYRKAAQGEVRLSESFEDGIPTNWAANDADGDGQNWQVVDLTTSFSGEFSAKDGNNAIMSRSWANQVALTPDNWLISPKVTLDGLFKYWIMDDGQYPETYRIYVSTTGTDIADFQPLTDDIQSPASQAWVQRSHDLSSFNGEAGYIAIRHYNCTDQDLMLIDLVTVEDAAIAPEDWTVVSNVSDIYTGAWYYHQLSDLEPKTTYEVEAQANYGETASKWTSTVSFETADENTLPSDLTVSPIGDTYANVEWNGVQEKFNLRYRTAEKSGGFFEDFEGNALPEGWTIIDADGDGHNWGPRTVADDSQGNPTGFGSYCFTSASWMQSTGALTPDNYLVTPQVDLKGTLSVWLRGQDPSYAAENFSILLSTTGNAAADFTIELVPETAATGVLTEYTADLSAYEGQKGYIAIRHYDITDMFYLNVDNFHIDDGNNIPAGEWQVVENIEDLSYKMTGLQNQTKYEVEVQGVLADGSTTDWTAPVAFTTLDKVYTLSEMIDQGIEGESGNIGGNLYMVAQTPNSEPITFVTDGEGAWAATTAVTATQFDNYCYIADAVGSLSNADTAPTLSFSAGTLYPGEYEPDLKCLDLTKEITELPAPCEVVKVLGFYDGQGSICANAPSAEAPGQSLAIDTSYGDFGLEAGQCYEMTVGIIKQTTRNGEAQPLSMFSGIVIGVTEIQPDGVDGVINNNVVKDVRFYDITGRYVGTTLDNAPSGIYIRTDGKKIFKK